MNRNEKRGSAVWVTYDVEFQFENDNGLGEFVLPMLSYVYGQSFSPHFDSESLNDALCFQAVWGFVCGPSFLFSAQFVK